MRIRTILPGSALPVPLRHRARTFRMISSRRLVLVGLCAAATYVTAFNLEGAARIADKYQSREFFEMVGVKDCYAEVPPERDDTGRSLNLMDPRGRAQLIALPTITVHTAKDLLYKNIQGYQGYEIRAFVNWITNRASLDPSAAVVTFVASDGYRLTAQSRELLNTKRIGALAFRLVGAKEENPFPDATVDGTTFNPGPFVLVWDGEYDDPDHLPRPWSVVRIEVAEDSIPQEYAPPYTTRDIMKGLGVFREQCSKCHSINKVGGSLGPELNVPRNVTEYWSRNKLAEFIKEPRSFRRGSRMPSFAWLGDEQIEELIQYLMAMKDAKACNTKKSCKIK
jgi:cytochrome c2